MKIIAWALTILLGFALGSKESGAFELPAATAAPSAQRQNAREGAASEVREATLAFYRALNAADPEAADQFLLPGGDSFPRSGALLLPEAATAAQSLKDLQVLFDQGLRFDVKVKDLQVKAYGAAAIATFYLEGTTTPAANRPPTLGVFRASYVWVRRPDGWKIAHFHISPLHKA